MNCIECQEKLSAYIDLELSKSEQDSISVHLSSCEDCNLFHADLIKLCDLSEDPFADDSQPPNAQALWCRINNIIESEIEEAQVKEPEEVEVAPAGIFGRSFSFSTGQVFASLIFVALISSLVTVVAFQNLSEPDSLAGFEAEPSMFEKTLAKIGLAETPAEKAQRKFRERQSALDYWSKRVAKRRVQWDTDTRVTFDRNVEVIDKAVQQYTILLKENPHDEISTEMLDSALSEKMELLREFSEL